MQKTVLAPCVPQTNRSPFSSTVETGTKGSDEDEDDEDGDDGPSRCLVNSKFLLEGVIDGRPGGGYFHDQGRDVLVPKLTGFLFVITVHD